MKSEPVTLQEAILYFAEPENCRNYMVARRWPNGVTCPCCGSANVLFMEKYNRWHCREKHDAPQFTLKTGTIMEDSPIGLDKWLTAMWMVVNCKNGVSSYEIHRDLGITQKTAWFLDHRIRLAVQAGSMEKFSGEVEADETYVGGKAEFMHMDRRTRKLAEGTLGRGGQGKAIVFGLLDRNTKKAHVKVVSTPRKGELRGEIKKNVEAGSQVYTDALKSYRGLPLDGFVHDFIDHAEAYVRGAVHTNGMENFWSLFKRALKGTYVSVEPFHLQAYADEQAYRFNHRKLTDAERFDLAVKGIVGKRITFDQLTGKTPDFATCSN
jgi:transposase-like protein